MVILRELDGDFADSHKLPLTLTYFPSLSTMTRPAGVRSDSKNLGDIMINKSQKLKNAKCFLISQRKTWMSNWRIYLPESNATHCVPKFEHLGKGLPDHSSRMHICGAFIFTNEDDKNLTEQSSGLVPFMLRNYMYLLFYSPILVRVTYYSTHTYLLFHSIYLLLYLKCLTWSQTRLIPHLSAMPKVFLGRTWAQYCNVMEASIYM